jgi:hypothetical protein
MMVLFTFGGLGGGGEEGGLDALFPFFPGGVAWDHRIAYVFKTISPGIYLGPGMAIESSVLVLHSFSDPHRVEECLDVGVDLGRCRRDVVVEHLLHTIKPGTHKSNIVSQEIC